jgi:hypothetical protein
MSDTPDLARNNYGALTVLPEAARATASTLLTTAINCKKLQAEYINGKNTRHGWLGTALNYDFYDVKDAAVLVQQRITERTKYGVSPRKEYFIIRRRGKGVTVSEASKARVAKLAKVSRTLGDIIDTLEGRSKRPLKAQGC